MSFWDQLRPASFRGVAFYVDTAERSGGRRGVEHEYPRRDRPYFEDLGRKARSYTVEAYLLGDDLFDQRDALVAALEEAGGGRLVHPYLGTLQVAATDYRDGYSKGRGRYCTVAITFVDAGENRVPTARADTAARVRSSADAASLAVRDGFERDFSVADQPQFVKDDAVTRLRELTAPIDALGGQTAIGGDQSAASFARRAARLSDNAPQLVEDPAGLAGEVAGLVADVAPTVGDAGRVGSIMREVATAAAAVDSIVSYGTPARTAMARNDRALSDLVRRSALIEETRALSDLPFGADAAAIERAGGTAVDLLTLDDSSDGTAYVAAREDAAALRDDLGGRLDDELDLLSGANGATPDDVQFDAVEELRARMVRDVDARATGLAQVRRVQVGASLPALVLAHREYGDEPAKVLPGETSIVGRNDVHHPGFLPGGEPLQVLSVVSGVGGGNG